MIENTMAQNLRDDHHELTGWRKSTSGSKVDFVTKSNDTMTPIECKSAQKIQNSHLGGLRDFMKIHNIAVGLVVSLAPFEVRKLPEGSQIIILPLYLGEY